MIISRKAGNITIFSFDENEGLSEHTAPFDAVVTILEGECEVWVCRKDLHDEGRRHHHLPGQCPSCPVSDYEVQDVTYHDQGVRKMGGDDKDGYYCSICGGIPPDKITTKRVLIDGKETGIDHLDWIFDEVKKSQS